MVPSYGRGMLDILRKKTRITHPQHASMKKCGPCVGVGDIFFLKFSNNGGMDSEEPP